MNIIDNHDLPWPVVPFKEVAEFKNGLNFKADESGCSIKVLGVGDFQNNSRLDQISELATIQTNKKIDPSYHLEDGDLVFFVRSNGNKRLVGRCLLIYTHGDPVSYSGFTIRARLRCDNLKPEFVSLLMHAGLLRNVLKKEGRGTNISNLNQGILSKLPIPVPTLSEQQGILEIFYSWDVAIEKTERLIAAKQKRFDWLRSHLMRSIKNTKIVSFGNLLQESRAPNNNNDPTKRLTVRLHLKGVEIREYRGTEAEGATQYFTRKSGQLIYGKQNIFRGAIGIIPKELNGYVSSQDIPSFDICDSVSSDWLYWYMSRPSFYEKLEHFAAGSGSKRLHPKELFKMELKLPLLEQQKEIANTLNTAKEEITYR